MQDAPDYLAFANLALSQDDSHDYWGGDKTLYVSSAPTWSVCRDADADEREEFEALCRQLIEAFPAEWTDNPPEEERFPVIYVLKSGHYKFGYIESIVVPVLADCSKPLSADNIHPAFVIIVDHIWHGATVTA